jgi:hypothetical protein
VHRNAEELGVAPLPYAKRHCACHSRGAYRANIQVGLRGRLIVPRLHDVAVEPDVGERGLAVLLERVCNQEGEQVVGGFEVLSDCLPTRGSNSAPLFDYVGSAHGS